QLRVQVAVGGLPESLGPFEHLASEGAYIYNHEGNPDYAGVPPAPVWLNAAGLNDSDYLIFAPVHQGLGGYGYFYGSDGHEEISLRTETRGTFLSLADWEESGPIGADGSVDSHYFMQYANIDGVEGSRYDDVLVGNSDANALDGREGDDLIDGGGGFDFAEYNWSPTNGDFIFVNLSDEVQTENGVTLQSGEAHDGRGGTDTLVSIEGLIGGSGDDIFYGNDGKNLFYGKAGDDVFVGGDGEDRYFGEIGSDVYIDQYDDSWDRIDFSHAHLIEGVDYFAGIVADLRSNSIQDGLYVDGVEGTDAIYGVHRVSGSVLDDQFFGDGQMVIFSGGQGSDLAFFGDAGGTYQFWSESLLSDSSQMLADVAHVQGISVVVDDGSIYDLGASGI
ncbi:MAG: hypothetical protein EB075_14655, partial [Bacteroidetes bacterium]|nr:hypothetical protein [Bacteroidota bacterium]